MLLALVQTSQEMLLSYYCETIFIVIWARWAKLE